ncbi:hypothetical protein N7467_002446 [Penicillium canescens]|nr:hypothetical protein N7467_002446 [Penicillium canescens]
MYATRTPCSSSPDKIIAQLSGACSHYYGRIDAWRGAGKLVQDLIDEASLRGSDESCTADRLEDCGRRSPLTWNRDSG